jgi:hypothetical protein
MPNLTFTFSAASLTEVTAALCALHGYQVTLPDGSANPETQAVFAKRMVIEGLKRKIRDYRNTQAQIAVQAAVSVVDPDIT